MEGKKTSNILTLATVVGNNCTGNRPQRKKQE